MNQYLQLERDIRTALERVATKSTKRYIDAAISYVWEWNTDLFDDKELRKALYRARDDFELSPKKVPLEDWDAAVEDYFEDELELKSFLNTLPQKTREVIELKTEGYSVKEIASMKDVTERSIQQRLKLAKNKFKKPSAKTHAVRNRIEEGDTIQPGYYIGKWYVERPVIIDNKVYWEISRGETSKLIPDPYFNEGKLCTKKLCKELTKGGLK